MIINNERQKRYYHRHKNDPIWKEKYCHKNRLKNINYLITTMYHHLKNRAKIKSFYYPSKEEFKNFAINNKQLRNIHTKWIGQGKRYGDMPSVDRIDNNKGYYLNNIQFITHSDNVSKGNKETKTGKTHKPSNFKKVILKKGKTVKIFNSGKEACDFLNIDRTRVSNAIKKQHKLCGWGCEYAMG